MSSEPSNPSISELSKRAEHEFARAHAIAKQALTFIGTFKTPPTPEIYELWYRYVEGAIPELQELLSDSLRDATSMSSSYLMQLRDRFFPPAGDPDLNQKASSLLVSELGSLQATLEDQQSAGNTFESAVSTVGRELSQPLTPESLSHCIESVMESSRQIQRQIARTDAKLTESQRQIAELRRELLDSQKALMTDSLTGVGNRRFFESLITQTIRQYTGGEQVDKANDLETSTQAVLLLVDLDEFKKINDTSGHITGDEVLRFVAKEIQRISDAASVARIGGDEFAIILFAEHGHAAKETAEDILAFFANQEFTLTNSNVKIDRLTLSIGGALIRPEDNRETWFQRADQLLYAAKTAGRNQVKLEPRLGR